MTTEDRLAAAKARAEARGDSTYGAQTENDKTWPNLTRCPSTSARRWEAEQRKARATMRGIVSEIAKGFPG